MDPTFTDAEKRFVLAEIIKVSDLDVSILVDLVKYHNIDPDWLSMQVPNGRNLGQCIKATEALFDRSIQYPNLKRRPVGNLVEIAPKRQALDQPRPIAIPRVIQPRPSSNGYISAPSPTVPAPTTTGRKRGRPSKAEKEAQLRAGGRPSVFSTRQGQPGNYPSISAAPPPTSMAPLPSISTVSDYPVTSSPATAYNIVSGSPEDTTHRRGSGRSLPNTQHECMLQETRPSDSNVQWQPGMPETTGPSHSESTSKSNFPSQPRQMPSPMEPRQLPSLAESMPSTLVGRFSASERPTSPMSQPKPDSHFSSFEAGSRRTRSMSQSALTDS